MAYVANESGTEIYLATHRTTRKFRNLTTNPAVSLMIDTRQEAPRTQVRALTVEGACAPVINEARKDQVRAHFLAVHSHLKEFLGHDDCELLCVTVTSFLLLNGLTEAHYATLA
jgi:nitroimidazol reductase NimA-like FMN-containing flavoprotein (pyridoxamine 5'-phosphate oxidase superfamily)